MNAFLVSALLLTGCANDSGHVLDSRYAGLSDRELWFEMRSVGVLNELRCRGLTAEQAKATYRRRFAARENAIDAAMLAKYGPLKDGEGDRILIGFKCPAYRGAVRKSEAIKTELERRLGPPLSNRIK